MIGGAGGQAGEVKGRGLRRGGVTEIDFRGGVVIDAGFGPVFDPHMGVESVGIDFGLKVGVSGGDRERRGAFDPRRTEEKISACTRLMNIFVFVVGVGRQKAVMVGLTRREPCDFASTSTGELPLPI